jgi:hypothetical protein
MNTRPMKVTLFSTEELDAFEAAARVHGKGKVYTAARAGAVSAERELSLRGIAINRWAAQAYRVLLDGRLHEITCPSIDEPAECVCVRATLLAAITAPEDRP